MPAIPQSACSENDSEDNIKGIVFYGDSTSTPSTIGYDYVDSCDDETDNIVPYLSKTVDDANWSYLESATVSKNSACLFKQYLDSIIMLVDWTEHTLEQVYNNVTTYETDDAVVKLSEANQWAYLVVETTLPVPHPIYLHGHDFFIVAQGTGTYSSSITPNTRNLPRRDTAMLPGSC
jgi:hypothetical protein